MAKNFLDQAFSILGLKSPRTTDYYDPSVYKTEVTETTISKIVATSHLPAKQMTGAAKYQQKKNLNLTEKKGLSSVEKYLLSKQQLEEISTEDSTEKQLTGVAKYLSVKHQKEQAALDNMTGVAKYLYYRNNPNKKTPIIEATPKEKEEVPVKLSRVDRYIAKQQKPMVEQQSEKVSIKEPKVLQKDITQTAIEKEKITRKPEKNEQKIVDLSKGANQCQAATVKGTQCRRKKNIQTIERVVNKQQYRFSVCKQHSIDSFIPFKELLQE